LPRLPADPYSGKPFGYRRSEGQWLLPVGLSGTITDIPPDLFAQYWKPTQPGQWLLYSVGPDGIDDGAANECRPNSAHCDLVFPLPPTEKKP
jgi:hypothetical protein